MNRDAVVPPRRQVGGSFRITTAQDDPLLLEWLPRFDADAGLPADRDPVRSIDRRRRPGGGFWLWEDGGPTCLVGHTPLLCGVPRIGPVFTPRSARGQGYAQALTAAVCSALLARGAEAVTLFADAANPASNAAYLAIGFRPVGEIVEIAFT